MTSRALTFDCSGQTLLGLLHTTDTPATRGAVIVVGGPQYRVGSHRQFKKLAEGLAARGVATLRFDYRGMGDSDGDLLGFEHIDDDIRAAVDTLCEHVDTIEDVTLIGLCDAASAILMYASDDARVRNLALMNPWVRSDQSHARATVKHYYLQRILAPELWRKLLRGQFDWRGSWRSLRDTLSGLRQSDGGDVDATEPKRPFQERMLRGAECFAGDSLYILSGDDMTAAEFDDHTGASDAWGNVFAEESVHVHRMTAANHTFSCALWRDEVSARIADWLVPA
ncbi:MAG: hydrolase 1, exosortase A system-associated [Gammaproteobacteria bacterium]